MGTKRKITELEYLRAFSFLAVVLQHAIGHYAYEPSANLADGVMLGGLLLISKFAVPMFIFISGLVLFYNYQGPLSYATFLLKRCKDILLPYLPWAILYALLQYKHFTWSWDDLLHLGLLILTGTAGYHLWYVVMIFQFYIIFPLIRPAILWVHQKANSRLIVAGLIGLGMLYIGLTGKVSDIGRMTAAWSIPGITAFFGEYSDRNALYFFFYFLLGAYAGLNIDRFKEWLYRWRHAVVGGFVLLLLWMWYRIISHFVYAPVLKIHYNDTFLLQPMMAFVLIWSILAMYVSAVSFNEKGPVYLRNLMSMIGSYSYVAYLAHALLLIAATWLSDLLLPFGSATLKTVISFLMCSVFSVAAAYMFRNFTHRHMKKGSHSKTQTQ